VFAEPLLSSCDVRGLRSVLLVEAALLFVFEADAVFYVCCPLLLDFKHFSSFTAFEMKGCEKACSGVILASIFHSMHF